MNVYTGLTFYFKGGSNKDFNYIGLIGIFNANKFNIADIG